MKRAIPFAAAFLAYLVLAVALTWPLALRLGTVIPHDAGDPVLNTWILWWNAHHVPLSTSWWNAPAFFPVRGALGFSESLLALTLLTTPLQWLGLTPLAAYNTAFLLSFPLSALSMHLLVFCLTKRHSAGFIGGLAFGFAPYRIAHLPHIQILTTYWIPVALVGLHRYARTRAIGWIALFAIAWILVALANAYYMFFFSVLVGLWLLWFLPPWGNPAEGRSLEGSGGYRAGVKGPRRCIWWPFVACLIGWATAALALVPLLVGYRAIQHAFGMRRSLGEMTEFSADVVSFLDASPLLAVWHTPAWAHRPEGELFPAATVVALVLGVVVWTLVRGRKGRVGAGGPEQWAPLGRGWRIGRTAFAAAAAVSALFAASAMLFGSWRATLLGLTLSVTRVDKALRVTFLSLLAFALTSRPVRRAYSRGSVFSFYLLATLVMWLLSLGPEPRLLGTHLLWYKAPYAWLMVLPGFDSLRTPARFAMMAVLCLSIAAGLAVARFGALTRRLRLTLVGVAAIGILADGWVVGMPLVPAPPRAAVLDGEPQTIPVLELPGIGNYERDLAALYRSMPRRHPVVNGFSGYIPRHYDVLRLGLELHDHEVLRMLARRVGALHIVVSERLDPQREWSRFVSAYPGIARVRSTSGETLYRIVCTGTSSSPSFGSSLPIRHMDAAPAATGLDRLRDRDYESAWTSPTVLQGTEEIVIDLGSPARVGGVRLALGSFANNFPRRLRVDGSLDGQRWTTAWEGPTAALALAAALDDQRTVPLTIDLGERIVRFLRLRQLMYDDRYPWSIAELDVLSPAR